MRTFMDEKLRKAARRRDRVMKWFLTVCTIVVVSIPADLFFLIKGALEPVTFWEKFAVWVGGIAVFGGAQLWFLFLGFGFLLTVVWTD